MKMDRQTRSAIAKNVVMLRSRAKLTQTALGKRAGIGQTTVSSIEDPEGKSPTIETIDAIGEALNVPGWMLLIPQISENPTILRELDKLVETYMAITDDGRKTVVTIAEAEARYLSATKPPKI